MRIQHNIAAMNAYRNYNNNTSSLSKNLEKLSSGYKINRAGDDAAGLAISEKMRAQITGLNAAQKNVKDGVSLVKTAEGAMQEIQDMLNRMDYLATQSANGTYDNEVDRANLQKEVDALKTEINRIADSANFNGIKLLDGSLDENKMAVDATTETTTEVIDPNETIKMEIGGALPEIGLELGVDTVKHNNQSSSSGTEFSVAFHDFTFDAAEGNEMTIKVGDTTINVKSTTAGGSISGSALVNLIVNGTSAGAGYEVTVNGVQYDQGEKIKINGQDFSITAGAVEDGKSHSLKFIQDKAPTTEAEEVDGSMKVTVSGDIAATKAKFSFKFTAAPTVGDKITLGEGRDAVTVELGGTATSADLKAALDQFDDFDVTVSGSGADLTQYDIILTAKKAGAMDTPKITLNSPSKNAAITGTNGAAHTAGVVGVAATAAQTAALVTGGATAVTIGIGTTAIATVTVGVASSGSYTVASGNTNYTIEWEYSADDKLTIKTNDTGVSANGIAVVATTGALNTGVTATLGGGVTERKASADFKVDGMTKDSILTLGKGDNALKISQGELKNFAGGKTVKIGEDRYKLTYDSANGTLSVEQTSEVKAAGEILDVLGAKIETIETPKIKVDPNNPGEDAKIDGMDGDYNVSTVDIKNVDAGGKHRLASTYFDLTDDMVRDGSEIRIGNKTYTFTTNADNIGKEGYVDATSGDLSTIAKNLTAAASGNVTWTVGHDGSRITLTETMAHDALYKKGADGKYTLDNPVKDFDLTTKEGIEASLGFKGVAYEKTETTTTEAIEGGKPLTLQIGDTSDDFNQMKVSIGDMHVSAMKLTDEETGESTSIADIDISTQDGAAKAVDVIKASINYVSSVRGDLGAIQNRLEHTQNNLSVMAENIQDAESTIRDTDVAEEMMSYVKNNILVQSAQAMLAQANQLPQGVLQLLG